jgi:hypothetical protein
MWGYEIKGRDESTQAFIDGGDPATDFPPSWKKPFSTKREASDAGNEAMDTISGWNAFNLDGSSGPLGRRHLRLTVCRVGRRSDL